MCKFSRIPDVVLGTSIKDPKMKMLCIQLFALANFGEVQEHGHTLTAGQMITTLAVLMERTGLTKKEVRTRLDKLIEDGKLTKIGTNHYLILTIVGYAKYFTASSTSSIPNVTSSHNGTRMKDVSHIKSTCYVKPSNNNGIGVARNAASTTISNSACYEPNQATHDIQNDTPEGSLIENNKETVEEKGNNTTTISSLEDRRKWLVDETNDVITKKKWDEYARTMPEFNEAIRKFLAYMGTDTGNGKLRFERYNDFTVAARLTNWLNNERSLKNRIKFD